MRILYLQTIICISASHELQYLHAGSVFLSLKKAVKYLYLLFQFLCIRLISNVISNN